MSLRIPLIALCLLLLATCAYAQRNESGDNPDTEAAQPVKAVKQPGLVKQARKELAKSPQVIEVDILIADWTAAGGDGEKAEVDLFGPTDQVVAKVQALEKAGKITVSRRIRLSTVAGQAAHVQLGERRPQVTGVSAIAGGGFGGGRGGGGLQNSIQFANVGTLAGITTQAYEDGKLVVELQLERSEVDRHQEGPVLSEGADGQKIRAEGISTMQLQTTVALASGETVVVSGTSGGNVREIVLLSAKLAK